MLFITIRLNAFLAKCGVCSRRKADQEIKDGHVKVNGEIVNKLGTIIDVKKDKVTYNDQEISINSKLYYLLNKPKGYISSVSDEHNRPTVIDLLKSFGINDRLYPVGRLDIDTQGLLILTNDGEFTNIITNPKSIIEKEYVLRIDGYLPISKIKELNLKRKVLFENVTYGFKKIELVKYLDNKKSTLLQITLTQGKNHHVKNIFKSLGFKVLTLTRIRIDKIVIDNLQRGSVRELKIHEIKRIFSFKKIEKMKRSDVDVV